MTDKKSTVSVDGRDYEKFAYFASRASNCSIIYKPRVEQILASGEKVVARDEKGKEMVGHRIEFHNHNLMYEKNELNAPLIQFLRGWIAEEDLLPKNKKLFIEITKPTKQFSEAEVDKMIGEKDAEIVRLKKLAGGEEKAPSEKVETKTLTTGKNINTPF